MHSGVETLRPLHPRSAHAILSTRDHISTNRESAMAKKVLLVSAVVREPAV